MNDILNRYIAQSINNADNTSKAYFSDIILFLKGVSKYLDTPLDENIYPKISVNTIEDIFSVYREKFARSTVNRKINALRGFGDYLVKRGAWNNNRFQTLVLYNDVEEGKREYYTPTRDEVLKIIANTYKDKNKLRGARTRFGIAFMSTTGLRINNLLNIQKSQFDYCKDGTIMVDLNKKQMKNKTGCRIPICGLTLQYYLEYMEERNKLNVPKKYENFLFLSNRAKPFTSKVMNDNIRKYAEDVIKNEDDRRDLVNHSFREVFRTLSTDNNANRDLVYLIGDWKLDKVSRCYVKDGKHLDGSKVDLCNSILK